jgi:RNase P subunit RPR2
LFVVALPMRRRKMSAVIIVGDDTARRRVMRALLRVKMIARRHDTAHPKPWRDTVCSRCFSAHFEWRDTPQHMTP